MNQVKTYKFKLVPNRLQEQSLRHYVDTTRFVYNLCLNYKKTLYEDFGLSISKNDMQKELKDIKNETPWMKDIHSQVIQETTDRLFTSYDNFFRRVKKGETPGFPKFARKDNWNSFKFKQKVKVCRNTNKVSLPKIGKIKFRKSQEIIGDIKTTSIKKEADGWYISLTCELDKTPIDKLDNMIGIDLGIKDLVTLSDGGKIINQRTIKVWQNKLKNCQQRLARKKNGSNNRGKVVNELQKLHLKIARIRKEDLHQVSSRIVNENQVIVIENLNVKGMMSGDSKTGLNKHIADASWGALAQMLEYKSRWRGRIFLKVAPQFTSQDCSNCGYRNSELKLSDREWTCKECKVHHDRDVNAAINILNKGINKLKESGHDFSTLKYEGDIELIGAEAEEPQCNTAPKGEL